jgi:hypothetical protein
VEVQAEREVQRFVGATALPQQVDGFRESPHGQEEGGVPQRVGRVFKLVRVLHDHSLELRKRESARTTAATGAGSVLALSSRGEP